ncbi:MAG: hypothetical protein ABJL57_11925 [Hyphomonas sp.]|uniref:hypothetical protein n=1 Tax=Hyphomonas sp. TaxID=87 RepID=UPI003267DD31
MRVVALIMLSIPVGFFQFSAFAEPEGWPYGEEKEHSPGSYSTHWGEVEGWHLWRVDISSGRVCSARKSIDPEIVPVPVSQGIFDDPAPYVSILKVRSRLLSNVHIGGNPSLAKEYRASGERFFEEYNFRSTNWTSLDGLKVEFHLAGQRMALLGARSFDETFVIDMTGATKAAEWVEQCMAPEPSAAR